MDRISVLVYRQEKLKIGPAVVISADQTQTVTNVNDLEERLVRGVTKWIIGTPEGKRTWEYSSGDLNIGDLANCVGDGENDDPELVRFLADEGVVNLRIEQVETTAWNYDTILANPCDIAEAFGE